MEQFHVLSGSVAVNCSLESSWRFLQMGMIDAPVSTCKAGLMGWLMASSTENTIQDESLSVEWCFSCGTSICVSTPLSALPKWTIDTSEPPLWTSQWPFSSVGGRAAFHLTLQTMLQWSMRLEKILHKNTSDKEKALQDQDMNGLTCRRHSFNVRFKRDAWKSSSDTGLSQSVSHCVQ